MLAASTAAALLACGPPCDEEGCEAFAAPVDRGELGTGLVGVAGSRSDLVINDCRECPLSTGTLYVWASMSAVTSSDEAAALVATAPTHIVNIDERYALELPAGELLVCSHAELSGYLCAPVALATGEVATANVMASFGEGELRVFPPGSTSSLEVWSVDGPEWPGG